MIITPNGNRNGVLGLLNVNSRFKAPVGKNVSEDGEKTAKSADSALVGPTQGLFEAFSGRIDGIQSELSKSQAVENALKEISSSLQSLGEAVSQSGGDSARVNELRSKIAEAAAKTYDDAEILEGFDPKSLGIGVEGPLQTESVEVALKKVSAGLEQAIEETNRLTSEVKGLEVSRENLISSESRVREADFAGELLSMTTQQIGSAGNHEILKNVNFDNILKLLS